MINGIKNRLVLTEDQLLTNLQAVQEANEIAVSDALDGMHFAVEQIQKRGRAYEETIRLDYLKRLNERYEAWIDTYDMGRLLIVDVDNNNFSENPEHLGLIINKIDTEVNGLF